MGRDSRKYIPNCLRKSRKRAGFKQQTVAKKLNVSRSVISDWEKGLRMPNATNLLRLSALYRTLVNELYYDFFLEQREFVFLNDEREFSEQHLIN